MISFYFTCLAFCFFIHGAFAQEAKNELYNQPANQELMQLLVEGNNRFAFDCFQHFKSRKGNFCFSPYSVSQGLAMVAIGVKGETANQIQRTLSYTLNLIPLFSQLNEALLTPSTGVKNASQLYLACALWPDQGLPILSTFKTVYQRNFNLPFQSVDFEKEPVIAIQKINQWTSKQTQGKISQMINTQDVSGQARLVLTTAMSMKGQWMHPFDPRQTKRLPFHLTPQRTLTAEMMKTTMRALFRKGEHWDLLILPYVHGNQGAQLAMVLFIPKTLSDLEEMENQLTRENWRAWLSQTKVETVALTLPRFRIEDRFDLIRDLKSLGLASLFTPEADFSGMTTEKGVFVNAALQKTFIRVDEKGSDAGSAGLNSDSGGLNSSPGEVVNELVLDHPFVFVVMDQKTQSVLWMGRFAQP